MDVVITFAIPPLSALVLIGAGGAAIHLVLLALARPRTAHPLAVGLFIGANLALVAAVAAVLAPDGWAVATGLYGLALGLAAARLRDWSAPARAFFAYLSAAGLGYVVYVLDLTLFGGLGPAAAAVSGLLLLFEMLAIVLTLIYAYEALETLARVRWHRVPTAVPDALPPGEMPLVSIHVPTYSEPPELVIETLNALARLDYPRFEVLVIDNNTANPALWTPVQQHCQTLGERFQFFHVAPLSGFKAGACNFALTKTDPAAQIVAILDADYVVEPEFLRETVPHFRDPEIAFVQTPQDYREFEGNRYLTDCLHAYAYFFAVSMRARNEYNAAIFGGTMGLIRRSALEEIGGWDEWCITEDAEASLRLLQRGYGSLYINRSYGRGLMPFDFDAYKKQRFRWAFGGVQILRKHWRSLIPFARRPAGDRLTPAQRWWYLAASLLWFGEPLQLAFAGFLITGGLAYALNVGTIARPLSEAILLFPLLFLGLGIVRFLWVLRAALGIGMRDAIGAAVSMFSLSWVVTEAVLAALARPAGVFLRTNKVRATSTLALALHSARWETAIAVTCLTVAVLTVLRGVSVLAAAIALLAIWQSVVYGSAFVTSLSAVRSAQADTRPERYRRHREHRGVRVREMGVAGGALASLGIFLALAGSALAPTVVDDFARAEADRPAIVPPATLATPAPRTAPPEAASTPGPAPAFVTPQPFATAAVPAGPGAAPAAATPTAGASPPAAATLPPQASAAPAPQPTPAVPVTPGTPPNPAPVPLPTQRPVPSPTARGLAAPPTPPVDRRP